MDAKMLKNFPSWIAELKDLFFEHYEVREAYIPKIDWVSFYSEGLTPPEAVDRYFATRNKENRR